MPQMAEKTSPDAPPNCAVVPKLILIVAGGNRACGRDKGAMETDEVCGRPLDPFGAATFGVSCLLVYTGASNLNRRFAG